MDLSEIVDPEHWCFVSFVFYLKDDNMPKFGNVMLPMTGHITDDKGFVILTQGVRDYIEEDIKNAGKELKSQPVILNFKEL